MQRRHNLKSVTPLSNIELSDYENLVAVEIRNSGTGPLIITRFDARDKNGNSANNLIRLMPDLPDGIFWETYFEKVENFSIIPSKSLTVLKFSGDNRDTHFCEARDAIRKRLSEIEVTLTYRDIYGRKMPKNWRDMKWFARHFINGNESKSPKKSLGSGKG
ncbi:hypothetical protein ES703_89132 [subsurface metagenome]